MENRIEAKKQADADHKNTNVSKVDATSILKSRQNISNVKPLSTRHVETLEYINLCIKKRLQQDKINEKTRKEQIIKEENSHSFKPSLNKNYKHVSKELVNMANNQTEMTKQQRMDMMYEKGKIQQLKRINKPKTTDELDYEKGIKELTFKPILNEK